jgi:hypothetical protein
LAVFIDRVVVEFLKGQKIVEVLLDGDCWCGDCFEVELPASAVIRSLLLVPFDFKPSNLQSNPLQSSQIYLRSTQPTPNFPEIHSTFKQLFDFHSTTI